MEAKEVQDNKPAKHCANCVHYVSGFCVAYRKVNIVYPNGTCDRFKSRKENGWFIFYNERIHGLVFEEASEYCYDCNVFFKSKELAQQAIEILGKEIVMRAVEPLGFVKSK